MSHASTLLTLAQYMAGEFENREQAIAEPAWYVHLRLWQRPVSLFGPNSIALFAEQANVLNLDRPYRQRLIQLQHSEQDESKLQIQYYAFKHPPVVQGAGRNPELLATLTIDQVEQLPGCVLEVTQPEASVFAAFPPPNACCYFDYQGEKRQVSLGFEASSEAFKSYDKGIDINTGQALWGALLGPYHFVKQQAYAVNLTH